jgi:L-ribulose-5-phosphate 4-epimerase
MVKQNLIEEVARSAKRFWELKLTPGSDSGDTSLIDREEGLVYFLPQPSTKQPIKNWSYVGADDIAVTDLDGGVVGNTENFPTVEAPMHFAIYKARPDINAIVHSHGDWSQIFAGVRKDIPSFVMDTYHYCGGDIKCAEFGRVATDELAVNIVKALGPYGKAALMAGHGAACCGKDMDEAFFVAEMVERSAKQAIFAQLIGPLVPFTITDMIDIETIRAVGPEPLRAMGMNIPDDLLEKLGMK